MSGQADKDLEEVLERDTLDPALLAATLGTDTLDPALLAATLGTDTTDGVSDESD
uniref:Uncharacterized protein n=1 Tax=uncultured prokaryote TaxID=198431 RepID=A0A0H5QDM4_9ZZZZ|nr:hypothetical protein [uncultured prokaryote]